MTSVPTFATEAALCRAFILSVPPEWIIYPETAGWDILLVHKAGGWQIGIEAKLTLNTKVLVQAINGRRSECGPDFRAVLVSKASDDGITLAGALGVSVIAPNAFPAQHEWSTFRDKRGPYLPQFKPELPAASLLERIGSWWSEWEGIEERRWLDHFPTRRHDLPDYVPEVAAGVPSPIILSDWKIKAMRVCVWVARNRTITRAHFKRLGIDPSRWMNGAWLCPGEVRGEWIAGPQFPAAALRRDHPNIFAKIEADFGEWSKKITGETA